ncbi:MAG: hypothetical protein AB7L66_02770 [Gemmatimonadales bacterium]
MFPIRTAAGLLALAALSGCLAKNTGPSTEEETGFRGAYRMDSWTRSAITAGTTTINPATGNADSAAFIYAVDLGRSSGGVTERYATYQTTAASAGQVSFRWQYNCYHAFFQTNAKLVFFVETPSGQRAETVAVDQAVSGGGHFDGTISLSVQAGDKFGMIVGGRNYDSDGRLMGDVSLMDFDAPR